MYSTIQQPDELKLFPWKAELAGYNLETLRRDLIAGLEVSLLTVPQAIAYALVAGLPASCGLYAAIFSAFTAVLFGSSRYLIVGPVNAIAILIQAGTADILFAYFSEASPAEKELLALEIMTQIALLAGIFQILIAIFKLGRFTQFVSHSVVVGYLAGSALAIVTNQLFTFTGMNVQLPVSSLFEKLYYFGRHLDFVNLPTLTIGIASFTLLMVFRKISHRLPAAALMLACAALACALLNMSPYSDFSSHVELIGSTMDEFAFMPIFSWPSFNPGMMNQLLPYAFAIALLSIIETTCTAKSIAATSGHGIYVNQEILSVGLGNLVSSGTGSMPVSVSNSRSRLNLQSGAKTRMAAFFSVMLVAMIVSYFGTFVNLIPFSALSALLFIAAFSLVDFKQIALCLKSTSADAFVMFITFLACIFLALDTAFYIGVVLSISLYLKKAAMPELVEYAIEDTGALRSLDSARSYLRKAIRVIKVEGELFFGSADIFYTTLKAIAEDDQTTRVILLQLKNARDMDATTCLAILQLHEYLERAGRHLVMCGMTYEMWDVMSNSGLIAKIGKSNVFVFDEHHPQLYMQRALARAKDLTHIEIKPASDLATEPKPALNI